jgi:hypothetical protein
VKEQQQRGEFFTKDESMKMLDDLDDQLLVGIFPEGGMTRTGMMQAFWPGRMRVLRGIDVPVIPVYLGFPFTSALPYANRGTSTRCAEQSRTLERKP